MKFSRTSSLKKHINRHRKIKPYECTFPDCKKRFSEKGNLKSHLRVHVIIKIIKEKGKINC
jgi:uncharacterized Zn-finger protein